MRRIQLHLEEELDEALASQAAERGIPKAALVRDYLWQHVEGEHSRPDPAAPLIGMYQGDVDEHASVDEIVYGR